LRQLHPIAGINAIEWWTSDRLSQPGLPVQFLEVSQISIDEMDLAFKAGLDETGT